MMITKMMYHIFNNTHLNIVYIEYLQLGRNYMRRDSKLRLYIVITCTKYGSVSGSPHEIFILT